MFRWNLNLRTRNPLLRLFAILLGAVALVVVLVFGLFAAVALIMGGAIAVLVKSLRASQAPAQVHLSCGPIRRYQLD